MPRGSKLQEKWDLIPENVDILVTHGPPLGYGDKVKGIFGTQPRAGCENLLRTIKERVKPKVHICGHIHEDPGLRSDGHTLFVNASICTRGFGNQFNTPIVIDI